MLVIVSFATKDISCKITIALAVAFQGIIHYLVRQLAINAVLSVEVVLIPQLIVLRAQIRIIY